MLAIKTIVHPTDFSPQSKYALQLACSLARDHGARLVLMHVVSPPAVAYGEMITDYAIEEARQAAKAELESIRVADSKLEVEYRLEEGEPVTQIIEAAEEAKADLIVMGTHGRTGLGRLLLGSVAEAVLRRAPCPVLTVKTPHLEKAEKPEAKSTGKV